ncbi:MAG TPA: hypothetical protein VGI10_06950 [Polyangiaceae bacterium]|jgi:hypothetical protein
MTRALLLAQPVLTALVVAFAILVAGVPRPFASARVYGGATDGERVLALRVEGSSSDGTSASPLDGRAITVSASSRGGAPAHAACTLDQAGVCDVRLELAVAAQGPLALTVDDGSRFGLARGAIELTRADWLANARHRGGWIAGRPENGLRVKVAPARGVFAVPFADTLLIAVERGGQGVAGARLALSAEGGRLFAKAGLVADEKGRARAQFEASDHNPSVHVEARGDDGAHASLDTALPVVAGALFVARDFEGLRVASPIERGRAYFSVLAQDSRKVGGALALEPDGRGGSVARLVLPALPEPAWLMLSSEVDEHSAAAVGWPLTVSDEPQSTYDLPVRVLLDGAPASFAREAARLSRVRWLTVCFALLSLLMSIVLVLLRVRAADREIEAHLQTDLDAETARRVAPRAPLRLLAALLGIGLGFVALGLFVLAKI